MFVLYKHSLCITYLKIVNKIEKLVTVIITTWRLNARKINICF